MTVQTNTNVASFNGDGANKVFPVGYKFNSAADLVVTLIDDEAKTTQILTLNSDYTVTGAGDEEGGVVTLAAAPTSVQRLKVTRVVDILQLTDLRNQGKFYAEIHEDVFDLLIMIDQQQQTEIDDANAKSDEAVATANEANAKSDQAVAKADQNLVNMQAQYDAFEQGASLVVIGDYAAGLVVDGYNKVFRKDGEFYRAKAETTLPYQLSGDWAVDAPKFVSVGDAVLRQELAGPSGSSMIGRGSVVVPSVADLPGVIPAAGTAYVVTGYHAGSRRGGGVFVWDASGSRAQHNGGTVISPTVPWTSNPADYLSGAGEASPAAPGVFRRLIDGAVPPDCFGAVEGDSAFDSTPAIQKAADVLNYLAADGYYWGAGSVTVSKSDFRAFALSPSRITLNGGSVKIDPFAMVSGNYLLGLSWDSVDVIRTGAAGDALVLEGDYPVTKAVANFTLRNFVVESTGRGLVIKSGIIGEVVNVRPQNCVNETLFASNGNAVHFRNCRPFNGGAVVMDGMDNWSLQGGAIEKIKDVTGALQLRSTSQICQTFRVDGAWFEDNDGVDIVLAHDNIQVNTGVIQGCRFRNDTGLPGAIKWNAASNVHARNNRYTNYPHPHLRAGTVVLSTAQEELYGSSTAWCDSPIGLSRLDTYVAVVEVDFGTISANSTKMVNAPSGVFGPGSGAPVQATDSLQVSAIGDLNTLSIVWGAGITSAGGVTLRGINTTESAVVVGVRKFRVELYKQ